MLLNLIVSVLANETEGMKRNNVRLRMIGDIDRLTPEARASLENSMAETSGGTGLQVNLAISYSSRWEITEAMKKLAQLAAEGKIKPEDITEETISSHLTTASIPDPDILIRTGGEQRVSNYLLWQIAYSELYFTDIYWPDFRKEALEQAIIDYQSRERRFGLTSDQIKTAKK
jgi:undecaprenyl diphosphate synthase